MLVTCTHAVPMDIATALAEARARAGVDVVRINAESELDSSDRGMSSGVVELF